MLSLSLSLSLGYSFPSSSSPRSHRLSYLPLSFSLCNTLSRRCSSPFKQPMQYSAALGSRLWGRVGHRHQKKSPTWPEPPTVKLAPLSINRCASDRPLFLAPLMSIPFHPLFSTFIPFARSLPRIVFFSLRPLHFYYFFLSLSSLSFSVSLFSLLIALNIVQMDNEALMQSLSKLWFIANYRCD